MRVILHGGGNTLPALARAHALGIQTVEADVMLCFHDSSYDGALCVHPRGQLPRRTPEGHLACSRRDACALVERATGVRPLTLDELLVELAARGMHALLESKVAGTVVRTASALEGAPVTLLSFVGSELAAAAAAGVPRGCLIKHDPTPELWRALERSYGLSIYAPDHWYLSAETVSLAHAAGVRVVPWDVDEPEHARPLRALGVDAVISNEPEALLQRGVCVAG